MDAERWQRVQTLFLATLEQDSQARPAFLKNACGDDETILREVQAMLVAHQESHALGIENSLLAADSALHDAEALLGTHIGPHRLVRHLGRGGMGDVYLGERDDSQFRQQVAIKLVRPGLGTADLAARFRAERQILARLTHPHIAPLLDGGLTEDGRPYLVMQYIEGVPLTAYCNRHRLSIEERLQLFRQVCDAVQFAHRNLVVHRDLKPGNILVTESETDSLGQVKLLDFGIAKLLDPEGMGVSVAITQSEMRVMTPEYAAPEQVRGEMVTTVTDVYALGVLLYELLTEQHPYQFASRASAEVERIVCQVVPKRPSTVVSELEEASKHDAPKERPALSTEKALRRTPPGRLRKILRGDLDNIVMMALRKEPNRRYASVEALSEDVLRFLTGRPVTARPDTVGYRVGKFVRRNRMLVGSSALVVVLVFGFGVAMAAQAARLAEHAKALEEERDRVRRQVEKTTRVKTLVSDLFKVVDPNEAQGSPAERLQAASQRIVEDLAGEGELQAELMDEVLTIYINLGLYEAAVEMAEAGLEVRRTTFPSDDPAVAWGMHRLGEAFYLSSRFSESEEQLQQALALQRSALGDEHIEVAHSLVRLARLYRATDRYEMAESWAVEAWKIYQASYGDVHALTAEALYLVAFARSRLVGPEAAEALLREVLTVRREVLGDNHPDTAWTLVDLAWMNMRQDRLDIAEPLLQEGLEIQRSRYGDDHPDVSRTLLLLGRIYAAKQDYDQTEVLYRQALDIRRRRLGNDHVATAGAMVFLAGMLENRGAYGEAETLLLEALAIRRATYELDHRLVRASLESLVSLYEAWGRQEHLTVYRRLLREARSASS